MKKFLDTHAEWLLVGAGAVLAAMIAWLLVWGVTAVAGDIAASLADPGQRNTGTHFNLDGAKALDFKGLRPN